MFIKTRTLQPKNSSKNKSNKSQTKNHWFLQQHYIIRKCQTNIAFCSILEYYEHVV